MQSCHIYKHVIDRRISLILDKSACVSYLLTTFLLRHLLSSSPCCLCKLCGARRHLSAPLLFGSGLISQICTQPHDVCGNDEPYGHV